MSNNEYNILKHKDGIYLIRRRKKAHKTALKFVKNEEEKKRQKINTDINYNPLDKEIFKNNIELWRIKCYNVIGVI
jgi:hypothetical protein